MRRAVLVGCVLWTLAAGTASAQEPPPRIGPIVLDLHGTIPRFPDEDPALAASRGLSISELPGTGLGVQAGAHLYFIRWHLAFSFDVRFYALNPGTPSAGYPASPRTTFLSIGAGISLKP